MSDTATTRTPRLLTIPISHYCEKARWALDRAGIPYAEERHLQGVHRIAARWAGGGTTVPVLVTDSRAIGESHDILVWVDARSPSELRLFPAEPVARREVEDACRRLDAELGPAGRRLMYVHMLAQRSLALEYNNQGVPRWEAVAMRRGWPAARRFMNHALAITPGVEKRDEAVVLAELDHVAELISDGRPYLCGERFGAADLTFAALAAAVLVPSGYGVTLPQPEAMRADTAALVRRMREHPAGCYAMSLYERHRRETPSPASLR